MHHFSYKAFDFNGENKKGVVSAQDEMDAISQLRGIGLVVFEIKKQTSQSEKTIWTREISFGGNSIKLEDRLFFLQRSASLLQVKLKLDDVLRLVAKEAKPPLKGKLEAISESIMNGKSLSAAIRDHNDLLPKEAVALIEVGEKTAKIGDVFSELARNYQQKNKIKSEIKTALTYPIFLFFMAIISMVVLTFVLAPTIEPLFLDNNIQPPIVARSLIAVSHMSLTSWMILLVLAICFCVGISSVARTKAGRIYASKMSDRLPVFRKLFKEIEIHRFTQTLALMLRNNVRLLVALELAKSSLRNPRVQKELQIVIDQMKDGVPFDKAISNFQWIDESSRSLLVLGYNSNNLPEIVSNDAEQKEFALQQNLKKYFTLLTPVLTILIGAFIGGLIFSIMQAIFSLNDIAFQ